MICGIYIFPKKCRYAVITTELVHRQYGRNVSDSFDTRSYVITLSIYFVYLHILWNLLPGGIYKHRVDIDECYCWIFYSDLI